LTDTETSLFNETISFLQAQITAAKSQGLTGEDALEFIAMAECESNPPREITPVLQAWIMMYHESISSYDRICDNGKTLITTN